VIADIGRGDAEKSEKSHHGDTEIKKEMPESRAPYRGLARMIADQKTQTSNFLKSIAGS
jgi:hypothetical protein